MSLSNISTRRSRIPEEPSSKMIKTEEESFCFPVPEDVLQNILSFFPIKEAIKASLVSKDFKNSWMFCRDLDFGGEFGRKYSQSEALEIIKGVFNKNQASKINKLSLSVSYVGEQVLIESWIQSCIDKGLEELELDLLNSIFVMNPTIDFSAIRTLTVLKLCLVDFRMPSSSKGLKFLKTLSLSRTNVDEEIISAVFKNCLFLENLELIGCKGIEDLRIEARNHKRFSSLSLAGNAQIDRIFLDAPTLRSLTFSGMITFFKLGDVRAVTDLMLHFFTVRNSFMAFTVIDLVGPFSRLEVFTISNVFLEGLTRRIVGGNFTEVLCCYQHLRELQVLMEGQSYCNLFDVANFIKNCPMLERIYLDLNDFTFELGLYWEVHQKPLLQFFPYTLSSIKFVEIRGFRNHWHELDIIQFFLEKAPNLEAIALITPRKTRAKVFKPDRARIQALKEMVPRVMIIVQEHDRYVSRSPLNHENRWSL